MANAAIRIQRLWKEYRLGSNVRAGETFYEVLSRALRPSFLNRRSSATEQPAASRFWALRDISLELEPGEVMGIVGRNGAGKSTLLKVLTRITPPTRGRVEIVGRVASLLEVGTGFHPELTGRENIFLNGAILGMTRSEIRDRFDEIVSFAEVETFLETPIKRYSSGMHVRLAFAVAAHLAPDVLIVDEVLAVGDAAFQRKSLGKMEEAARGGRTVLFVSHNLGAVRNLCHSVALLDRGTLAFRGPVDEGLGIYEGSFSTPRSSLAESRFQGPLADRLQFEEIHFLQDGVHVAVVDPEQALEVRIRGTAKHSFSILDLDIAFIRDGIQLASCHDAPSGMGLSEGRFLSTFILPPRVLRPGRYTIALGAAASTGNWTLCPDAAALEVAENLGDSSAARDRGALRIPYTAERTQ